MIKFLDLKSQYLSIKDEIDQAIFQVIQNASFIGGEFVKQFEDKFANYVNAKYCIGVGNGTDALEIAIEALQLPPGSEVIVPANSFIASAEAVTRQGHRVVFADCDPASYLLCTKDVERKLTKHTKAIIAVHLYGHPCDMDALIDIADKNDLLIVEDCAQAHGAEYKGRQVGSIGHVGTFSFYPGKNLGAYGDGGAITTNNQKIAELCRKIANHGRIAKYDHEFEGRNSRLDGLQASILQVKLRYLPFWTKQRIEIADLYLEGLKDEKQIKLPVRQGWAKQVYHLFVIAVDDRDSLRAYLADNEIETGIHYPKALPKLEAYRYLGDFNRDFYANSIDGKLLSLPIGEHLNESDVRHVVRFIREYYRTTR